MYDLREHKELISQLVSEANQNDPNWEWSVRRLNKDLPFLNCPIDKAIEKMVRCIVNTAHACY